MRSTRWNSDFTTTVMDKGVVNGGFHKRCGYSNIEWVLDWRSTPLGDMYLAFLWMRADELVQICATSLRPSTRRSMLSSMIDALRTDSGPFFFCPVRIRRR